jgi:ABC-type multidrug transport system fused ATPase/permease subunit
MQLLIAKMLNRIFLLFSVVVLALFGGIFVVSRFFPAYVRWQILAFGVVSIVLSLFYRYLEGNWDKGVIRKMAGNGKIGLMNIKGGKRLTAIKDSSFKSYWIYELEGDLYNSEHVKLQKTFQEKMNSETKEIPAGSVYVTYDETKPAQIFIIPNAMIGSLPNLMPLVQAYEKDTKITVKYLDAHYNRGMVLRTFQETISDYKKEKAP